MTQRVHPAQRARSIALGVSAAAVAGIASFLGFASHGTAAATTSQPTGNNVGNVNNPVFYGRGDDDYGYYYGGAQPGAAAPSGNTASRGS